MRTPNQSAHPGAGRGPDPISRRQTTALDSGLCRNERQKEST